MIFKAEATPAALDLDDDLGVFPDLSPPPAPRGPSKSKRVEPPVPAPKRLATLGTDSGPQVIPPPAPPPPPPIDVFPEVAEEPVPVGIAVDVAPAPETWAPAFDTSDPRAPRHGVRSKPKPKGLPLPMILGGVGGGLALCAVVILIAWSMMGGGDNNDVVAEKPKTEGEAADSPASDAVKAPAPVKPVDSPPIVATQLRNFARACWVWKSRRPRGRSRARVF
jgi:hypothetical protein